MPTDRHDLILTTSSREAADAWIDGADRFLAADTGARDAFERAIAHDPDFALAHCGLARTLQVRALLPEARAAAARARDLAARATPRERAHADVFATMIEGDGGGALALIRAHAAEHPLDAFALQPATNVFGLIGFSGRLDREREVLDLLEPLADTYGDDWWYTGTLGFWRTEVGDVASGLALNRHSIEANPRNANAAHGLAHAHYESGDHDGGIEMLANFLASYGRAGGLHCHLSWHRALFELGAGRPDRMWSIYADSVAPSACPEAPPINAVTDSASLLWRASLFGEPVETARWNEVSGFSVERFPPTGIGFVDVHRSLAFAMAGDTERFERLVDELRAADRAGRLPWGTVTPDSAEGLAAFARGDDATTIARLEPTLDELVRIGGSGAQRDLFVHTLLVAYLRAGRLDDAHALTTRVPWRADRQGGALASRT